MPPPSIMPSNLGWIFLKYFFIGLWAYDRPFILLIIGIFTVQVVLSVRRARKLSQAGFDEIDTMSGVKTIVQAKRWRAENRVTSLLRGGSDSAAACTYND